MVLITGSSGHLGANLIRRLLHDGETVRALLRKGSDNSALNGLDVERVYGDLRDLSSVAEAVRGCDRIHHCAAKLSTTAGNEREIFDCNVIGTRNLLRAADFLPFCYGFAIVSMLLRADCKRLGDIAAATLVVHEPQAAPRITLQQVEPVAPVHPLAPRDQAALVALAARAPTLTGDRLDELAALAASVSGDQGQAGPAVTHRVLGVAQWLIGRRT